MAEIVGTKQITTSEIAQLIAQSLDADSNAESTLKTALSVPTGSLADLDEITDSEVATNAGIALSKLATDPLARSNHTGSQTLATISDSGDLAGVDLVTDAEVASNAAIASSKLAVGSLADLNEVTDSEVATGAAISVSKLSVNPVPRANHTGFQSASTIEPEFGSQISSNVTVDESYFGKDFEVATAVTITVPDTLTRNGAINFFNNSGGTLSIAESGSMAIVNATRKRSANGYISLRIDAVNNKTYLAGED